MICMLILKYGEEVRGGMGEPVTDDTIFWPWGAGGKIETARQGSFVRLMNDVVVLRNSPKASCWFLIPTKKV